VAVAVALVVFAAATAGANFRYAVPALPLLVLGTVLATAPGSRPPRALEVVRTIDLTIKSDSKVSSESGTLDSSVRN
jgi:hypothetical protein